MGGLAGDGEDPQAGALAVVVLLLARAACRLQGHFHERHYEPVRDVTGERRREVGDRPLRWWAVKRVSEYSGRINLWLAGGFGVTFMPWPSGQFRSLPTIQAP